jgi:hypothetical protein
MAEPEFTIEELANEEWRDVVGYEGIYSISNLGRVRRDLARNATPGKILKLGKKARGYFSVSLSINDKRRSHAVHKLVAAAFFGECPPGKQVNHKYPPKTNNRVDNLEYLTQRENIQHSIRTGLAPTGGRHGSQTKPESRPRGEDHGNAKLKRADIPRIFEMKKGGMSQRKIAEIVGVSKTTVAIILKGKGWVCELPEEILDLNSN